jgi:hypothetical protein
MNGRQYGKTWMSLAQSMKILGYTDKEIRIIMDRRPIL